MLRRAIPETSSVKLGGAHAKLGSAAVSSSTVRPGNDTFLKKGAHDCRLSMSPERLELDRQNKTPVDKWASRGGLADGWCGETRRILIILMRRVTAAIATFLVLTVPAGAVARPTGYDVAKRAHDNNSAGAGGERFNSRMDLYDAKGQRVASYELTTFNREGSNDPEGVTRSLVRFNGPPSTKGTALLTHEPPRGHENRWLYMSETRRVKQIGSGSKSASFKGSEVSYEDMAVEALDKYDYRLVGEHMLGDRATWKVESTPKFAESGYQKKITYYDQENGYPLKVEFFDRAGRPLKVMLVKGYEKVRGKWRPKRSQITNVQTKRKTVVTTGGHQLNLTLPDRMFTIAQLQRQ